MTLEIRCTAKHPRDETRECRNLLAVVLPGSVEVSESALLAPGCVGIKCERCGTDYVICPVTMREVA